MTFSNDANEQNKRVLVASAPAKLIISGEYSVLYGKPAIAMAVNLFATTKIGKYFGKEFFFDFPNLDYKITLNKDDLYKLKHSIECKYSKFLTKQCNIREVLSNQSELLMYAFANFLEKFSSLSNARENDENLFTLTNANSDWHMSMDTMSTIPIGRGIGSSAATIVSILHALNRFFCANVDFSSYVELAREVENIQHGFSSGLDVHVSVYGGCVLFKNGEAKRVNVPSFPMRVIDTGKPKSSTGECVSHTEKYFRYGTLLDDFSVVTTAIHDAIDNNDLQEMKENIKNNHRLLHHIGVVPLKVNEFVSEIERRGGAAKICGAGASYGQSGGVVLVLGDQDIYDIVKRYNYEILSVCGELNGVRLV